MNIQRPASFDIQPRKWTVAEVRALYEQGFLKKEDHVQLIEGVLYQIPGEGIPHFETRTRIANEIVLQLGRGPYFVATNGPAFLSNISAPEPDVYILPAAVSLEDMTGTDVLLAIEVAHTSLGFDLGMKRDVYASHGIQEYWVVNIVDQTLHIFTDPKDGDWGVEREQDVHTPVAPQAFPDLVLSLGDLISLPAE